LPPAGISASSDDIKTKKLGPDGKTLTQPRGIYPGSPKTGKIESSFFSKVAYTSIGDPYLDPEKRSRVLDLKKKLVKHDVQWRNNSLTQSDPTSPLFEHMTEHAEKKRPKRDEYGKVVTEKRNIFTKITSPGHGASTIGHTFSKPAEFMADPYERSRELERKEKLEDKKKLQDQPFKSATFPKNTFASDKNTFSASSLPVKEKPVLKSPKMHDTPFRPSGGKKGIDNAFGKFPEHIPDPIRKVVRRIEDPSRKKEAFKNGSNNSPTRPTPSISTFKVNINREVAHISSGYF